MILSLLDLLLLLQDDCILHFDLLLVGLLLGLNLLNCLRSPFDLSLTLKQLVMHFSGLSSLISQCLLRRLQLLQGCL